MKYRLLVFSLILGVIIVIYGSAQGLAQPVLIKLNLKTANDYTEAVALGVDVYHRFDNFVIAEFERTKLRELDQSGLKYQVIDEEPWTERYFLVMPYKGLREADFETYGKIILKDPEWLMIKASPEKAIELRARRYDVFPIHQNPIPLQYKSSSKFIKTPVKYDNSLVLPPVIVPLFKLVQS